jgi:hypothetical protein
MYLNLLMGGITAGVSSAGQKDFVIDAQHYEILRLHASDRRAKHPDCGFVVV